MSNNPQPKPKAQTMAQNDLHNMHEALLLLHPTEIQQIETIRIMLRTLINDYQASAKLAVIATSLEIAISEGK